MSEEQSEGQAQVEAHAGSTYPEEPRAFRWQGKRREVACVEARWKEPGRSVYVVRDRDNDRFRLTYNYLKGRWDIVRHR